jgi:hypothetical protein
VILKSKSRNLGISESRIRFSTPPFNIQFFKIIKLSQHSSFTLETYENTSSNYVKIYDETFAELYNNDIEILKCEMTDNKGFSNSFQSCFVEFSIPKSVHCYQYAADFRSDNGGTWVSPKYVIADFEILLKLVK